MEDYQKMLADVAAKRQALIDGLLKQKASIDEQLKSLGYKKTRRGRRPKVESPAVPRKRGRPRKNP